MDWIAIAGAIGLGTLIGKILDIYVLGVVQENREKKRWLREKKMEAYSQIMPEILTMGVGNAGLDNLFDGLEFISNAILVTDDEDLIDDLRLYFVELLRLKEKAMNSDDSSPPQKYRTKFNNLQRQANELVIKIRKDLKS